MQTGRRQTSRIRAPDLASFRFRIPVIDRFGLFLVNNWRILDLHHDNIRGLAFIGLHRSRGTDYSIQVRGRAIFSLTKPFPPEETIFWGSRHFSTMSCPVDSSEREPARAIFSLLLATPHQPTNRRRLWRLH